jgi:hypothetical protein
MGTRYAKFAPENETLANALSDYMDTQLATLPGGAEGLVPWARRFEETFGPEFLQGHLYRDTNLNWVVAWPYDGPFIFNGNEIPKPAAVDPYMEFGVIVDTPDWVEIE